VNGPPGTAARLQLSGIRKVYPAVVANDGIDLTVMPGEIHAVLGENGAGKSTLMKIIYGVVKPDAGEIRWNGERVEVASPAHARRLGIGMVFQHFSLFETLNVTQNIALAVEGASDLGALARQVEEVSQRYGLPLDPRRLVHSLSVGERQRVEIVRCLLQQPKLLIMDEPTSVLTPQAVERLFDTLRLLSSEGCSILYISHKLDEIRSLCHRATVLRGGKVTGTCNPAEETESSMARMMIGKDLPVCEHPEAKEGGEERLVVAGLSHQSDDPFGTDLQDIHLTVRSGEIFGIAGVSGNGQQELLAALSGETPLPEPFPVRIMGVQAGRLSPGKRRKLGMCFVPEERLGRGAVPGMSLVDNALLTAHRRGMVKAGLVATRAVVEFTKECIRRFDVRSGGPGAPARSLSGGNLQKFIVGREVMQAPKVLVVSQPTWGVDVGAAAFIRQSLIDLRDAGTAILVVSEELDELFEICDRLAVIANGKLSPAVRARSTTVEQIGRWMSGLWNDAADERAAPTTEARLAPQA
jgi:simple sugar transport system ATP-binding protein